MGMGRLTRHVLPPGPVLSLTLIGVMVLSAVLYYRAVKVQRFLEPALALSQPRSQLSEQFNVLLRKEFGERAAIQGMSFGMGAVISEAGQFFDDNGEVRRSAGEVIEKLNRIFYQALQDEHIKSHVAVVLVGADYSVGKDADAGTAARQRAQRRAEVLTGRMLAADPRLMREFGTRFIAAAIPVEGAEGQKERLEFRIIPSEMLHIEVLLRLNKYIQ